MERLQKFLAHAGVASRRKCEELILEGRVKVNGKVVRELGTKIDPDKDKVQVDGRWIKQKEKYVYLMMNKPRGYVSTVSDERGRKTVMDLLKDVKERVYPVGRLDYDSEGLLLLTNDGELTQALTHPKHQIAKTYKVRVEGVPTLDNLERLANGVKLEDGVTAPARVYLTHIKDGNALLEITIREGKNRQVRRMCEYIGHPVKRLVRTRIGPLELRNMSSGEVRELNNAQLRELFKAAGIKRSKPKGRKNARNKRG
ncbi:pseudouridine synthase [Desulfohalotomaculum tongense]|uniref:pseudouridine synthase n=1 Tax=Desulforadius tongensis TaxID=1216062 RepID=UPI0019587887|nr:pseudouridine synthase [Desulforadius tongensis]MBM7854669.1 pseudouridine synthase [Desulforadius tongensis]